MDEQPTEALGAELIGDVAREIAAEGGVALLIYDRDGLRPVPLSADDMTVVGRAEPASVVVRDPSLSREHAGFELVDGEVYVEDLRSTNGTRVNGEPITTRTRISAGDDLLLGGVPVSLLRVAPHEKATLGLDGHDVFFSALELEVLRAQTLSRTLGLVVVRAATPPAPLQLWVPRLRQGLRPFDGIGLYSADVVEMLIVEPERAALSALAADAVSIDGEMPPLRAGVALYPESGRNAHELLDRALRAAHRAGSQAPVHWAPPMTERLLLPRSEPATEGAKLGPAMSKLYATVDRLADALVPVLIQGETGSGKEVVARAIHERGARRDAPMICVNCGAIPAELVESTLFGHERGAFTGAAAQRKGVFESANGGTVLLDELGELPPAAQAALLRVLETKRITRVGSTKEIVVDVRVLGATHRDLESMCERREFRWDLLYRLNAMTLDVPPLRERTDEIPHLVEQFIEQANSTNNCSVRAIAPDALALLSRYRFPGNLRELKNAIERAVVICDGETVTVDDLPKKVRALADGSSAAEPASSSDSLPAAALETDVDLKTQMQRHEAGLLSEALRRSKGSRAGAARLLGMPVRTLNHKIRQHRLELDGTGPEDR